VEKENNINNFKISTIHYACRITNINPKIISFLLQIKANVNEKDECGMTPLYLATIKQSNEEIFSLLFQHGADPKIKCNCRTS
jgi:ankyrin repeat protein